MLEFLCSFRLLNVEETYYEEQLGEEITKIAPQVHLLGEG